VEGGDAPAIAHHMNIGRNKKSEEVKGSSGSRNNNKCNHNHNDSNSNSNSIRSTTTTTSTSSRKVSHHSSSGRVTVPAISTSVKSVAGGQIISLKSLQLREPLRDAANLNVGVPSSSSTSTKGHESIFCPSVHSNSNNSNVRVSQEKCCYVFYIYVPLTARISF
jgi:hypothetical protein